MTGKHVTTSSRSATDSKRKVVPRRNTSIQTDVSTSSTARRRLRPANWAIVAHSGQVAFPQTRTGEFQNSTRLDASDEVLQRTLDGARVCPFSAQLHRLLQ